MGEGGGGEEKGRPDTKPFSKLCDHPKSGCGSDWITHNTPCCLIISRHRCFTIAPSYLFLHLLSTARGYEG